LKLPQLLSLYLYQTRKLDLPGIGSFVLDPAAVIPEQSDKNIHAHATGISFKNANILTPDDNLVLFIKEHTGKMKPLAAADLDFFLTTGKQLLNIGKPFYIEGVGTLLQNKEGKLDFTPGEYSTVKLEDGPERKERADTRTLDTRKTSYDEPRPDHEPRSNNAKQVLLLIALILGLAAIGWGGYYLYKRNTFTEPPVTDNNTFKVTPDTTASTKRTDTAALSSSQPAGATTNQPRKDSLSRAAVPAAATPVPGPNQELYKFVILETPTKARALRRYNQLLGFQLNIKMDQKDSSWFKLYFPIAASVRDTAYIKDSLATTYAARVRIEH
jgi:hypothetical protein